MGVRATPASYRVAEAAIGGDKVRLDKAIFAPPLPGEVTKEISHHSLRRKPVHIDYLPFPSSYLILSNSI